jgi:hypothetical protein
LRRDCRQDDPRPDIDIPSSHPGHQTKNHPARKGGNISSDKTKKKIEELDPQISQISQMGRSLFTAEYAEDEDREK